MKAGIPSHVILCFHTGIDKISKLIVNWESEHRQPIRNSEQNSKARNTCHLS